MRQPKVLERPVPISRIEAKQQRNGGEQGGSMLSKNQIGNGADEVRPADQPENPVPFGVNGKGTQGDDSLAIRFSKGERQKRQQRKTDNPQAYRDYSPALFRGVVFVFGRNRAERENAGGV